jgi:hypothetical protein
LSEPGWDIIVLIRVVIITKYQECCQQFPIEGEHKELIVHSKRAADEDASCIGVAKQSDNEEESSIAESTEKVDGTWSKV